MVIRPKRRATHCRAMATLCLMDPHVLTLDPAVHRCSRDACAQSGFGGDTQACRDHLTAESEGREVGAQ